MNDTYYSLPAIERLYTAVVAEAVQTVRRSNHHTAAIEAATWLIEAGVPLVTGLGLRVDARAIEPWARRQIALRRTARSICQKIGQEASHAVQR